MKTPWFTRFLPMLGPDRLSRTLPGIAAAAGAAIFAIVTSDSVSHGRAPEPPKEIRPSKTATEMAKAADAFLASLNDAQRGKAVYAFDSPERLNWHFVPRERNGLPLKEMTPEQRTKAENLVKTALSAQGWSTMQTIIDLEYVLHHMENGTGPARDSGRYFFTVFGKPGTGKEPWGWRVEGHHLALNFTLANGTLAATTPMFFGANPAEVRVDVPDAPLAPKKGTRALAAREDIGRRLYNALTPDQRKTALLTEKAYNDIQTGNRNDINPLTPDGVAVTTFNTDQKKILNELLDAYTAVMVADIGKERLDQLKKAGIEKIHFAWAGSAEVGQAHYYRVQGPTFLLEYDNTQNGANHIHSVWRDFKGDFGRDVLAEHHAAYHRQGLSATDRTAD